MKIDTKILQLMSWPGGFWIRIFSCGVWFATYAGMPELFSERNGYTRVFRLGRWARGRWLKREKQRGVEDMLVLARSLRLAIGAGR